MSDKDEIPKGIITFLRVTQIIGRVLLGIFCLVLVLAVLSCPPWICSGEKGVIYAIPFMAGFTILPLGLVLVLSTRKAGGEKEYGIKSLKNFANALFLLGATFILRIIWFIGEAYWSGFTWDHIMELLSKREVIPFVPLNTLLPMGMIIIIISMMVRNVRQGKDE